MSGRAKPAVLLTLLFAGGCFARQYRENPRIAVVDGDAIVQMKPESKFKNVFHPTLVRAERHSDPPGALEKVVGVTLDRVPRAYPVGLLDRFEVVNDEAAGTPYVVARCALTGVAAVYERRVDGRTLEFINSGALWRDTLVLRDRETRTYWSAATGAALSGPLAGRRLHRIPAVLAREADWSRSFPKSVYFDMQKATSVPVPLLIYGASPLEGVSGRKTEDRTYEPKQEVFTVSEGDEAVAFTAEEAEKAAPVTLRLAARTVSVEWDSDLQAPRAFESGDREREMALVPMYWFAVTRHFRTVRTLASVVGSASQFGSSIPEEDRSFFRVS